MSNIVYYTETTEDGTWYERWIDFDSVSEVEHWKREEAEGLVLFTEYGARHTLDTAEQDIETILTAWKAYVDVQNGGCVMIEGTKYHVGVDLASGKDSSEKQSTRGAVQDAACDPESADSSAPVESGSGEDVPDGHPGLGEA